MQLSDINYKPHGVQSLRDLINCAIGAHLYSPPDSGHHTLLRLDKFHGTTHHQVNSRDNPNAKK